MRPAAWAVAASPEAAGVPRDCCGCSTASSGGQASWLIPAVLILLLAGFAFTLRARRTDAVRASLILWGGWLLVTALAFSLSRGIIHPYYTVALAPATGAIAGIGASALWRLRHRWQARTLLAAALAAAAVCPTCSSCAPRCGTPGFGRPSCSAGWSRPCC